METTIKIAIKVPDKNTPGFARRMYRAAKFGESMKAGVTPSLIEEMVDFLSEYIEGDRAQAKEYLWDCTELQFNQMIGAVSGGSTEQIPPPNGENSATP
jgi:hypothetical protein